ncbi:unnamed protein product [Fraxinus pennsylvanica]|uniref:WAT1-related protein n=1 Tax=Fraxinus pennsylvanica TaxID=56036 RepID=A0AAD1ZGK0_9LAMI|nr:unnamed protein product [Fraxinus pennsylvanica]
MKSFNASYIAMVVVQIAYGVSNILMKLALQKGLNPIVFVVYRHLIAILVLSPFAYIFERKTRPSLSFRMAMKIILLSSMGTTVHLNLYHTGLEYTSPTVGSALSNVMPSLTEMETVKLDSNRGKAKLFGTLVCIGGSFIFTFCKGKRLFTSFKQKPLIQLYDTEGNHKENWVKGALLILISEVALSAWIILQKSTPMEARLECTAFGHCILWSCDISISILAANMVYQSVNMTSGTANANGECLGWAARDPSGILSPYKFSRRAVGSDDVSLDIAYCGVCYADVVWNRN